MWSFPEEKRKMCICVFLSTLQRPGTLSLIRHLKLDYVQFQAVLRRRLLISSLNEEVWVIQIIIWGFGEGNIKLEHCTHLEMLFMWETVWCWLFSSKLKTAGAFGLHNILKLAIYQFVKSCVSQRCFLQTQSWYHRLLSRNWCTCGNRCYWAVHNCQSFVNPHPTSEKHAAGIHY